jgi:hypothetical protein
VPVRSANGLGGMVPDVEAGAVDGTRANGEAVAGCEAAAATAAVFSFTSVAKGFCVESAGGSGWNALSGERSGRIDTVAAAAGFRTAAAGVMSAGGVEGAGGVPPGASGVGEEGAAAGFERGSCAGSGSGGAKGLTMWDPEAAVKEKDEEGEGAGGRAAAAGAAVAVVAGTAGGEFTGGVEGAGADEEEPAGLEGGRHGLGVAEV